MQKFIKIFASIAAIAVGSSALADPQICQETRTMTFGSTGFLFTERVTTKVSDEYAVYFDPQWYAPHYRMEDHAVAFLNDDVDSIHLMYDPWYDLIRVVDAQGGYKPRNMEYHHPDRELHSWYDTFWWLPSRGSVERQFNISGRLIVDAGPAFSSRGAVAHRITVDNQIDGSGAREGYLVQLWDPNRGQWIVSAMRFSDFNAFRARLEGWTTMLRNEGHRVATLALGSTAGGFYVGGDVDLTLATIAALGVIFNSCHKGVVEYQNAADALRGVRGYMSGEYQRWNTQPQLASFIPVYDAVNMNEDAIIDYLIRAGFSDALSGPVP